MSLARRIPILRNNPVFVLEAPRMWRWRNVVLVAVAVPLGLVALSRLYWHADMHWAPGGAGKLGAALFPECSVLRQWTWGMWDRVYTRPPSRHQQPWPVTVLLFLSGCALVMAKYVAPALIGSAVARRWARGADDETRATLLAPRAVGAGLFWAGAGPAVVLATLAFCLSPFGRGSLTYRLIGTLPLPCSVFAAGAVSLWAARRVSRRHYVLPAAFVGAWVAAGLLYVAPCAILLLVAFVAVVGFAPGYQEDRPARPVRTDSYTETCDADEPRPPHTHPPQQPGVRP